jgi:hypothetical protein
MFINSSSQLHSTPAIFRRREKDKGFTPRNPTPIATTLGAGAFAQNSFPAKPAKLYINDVETDFISAEINAPRKSLGKSLQITLARAELAQLPTDAVFRFEIIKKVSGVEVVTEILDGATLLGKNYSVSFERDSLSFTTLEPLADKLSLSPKNNLIVFDGNRSTVATEEIENLYTNTDEFITTTARDLRPLTLYKLLDIAFKEGCGFASVKTNLPNYQIVRCDFSVTQSYTDAVAAFVGVFEPEIFAVGDVIWILDTTAAIPTGFEVETLQANRYSGFNQTTQNPFAGADGIILQYLTPAGSFYQDRELDPITETSGEYGTAGYTETTTVKTLREWKDFSNPLIILRSEVRSEIRETVVDSTLVGRETAEYTFDKLGRATGYTKTLEARMPDVDNSNLPTLLQTRSESQIISYKTNPFASRQTYQSRIETRVSALMAVDAENTALDAAGEDSSYKQDYEKVFEAGNLKTGMTSEFAVIETGITQFIPKRNGQVEIREERFDALRGKPKAPRTESRSGDVSVQNRERQQTLVIFKEGVTQDDRTGRLETLNAGELPRFFAEPLAERKLAEVEKSSGQIEVPGFEPSLERGILFDLRDRDNETFGNFLTSGFRVNIQPASIKTTIDAIKI